MSKTIINEIEEISAAEIGRDNFLMETARIINRYFPRFNWVGYYFLKEDGRLHVGPYWGKPTPHTVIDQDSGICGAAVSQGETIIVDDVNQDPRYLACSIETRSEIVIPIRHEGKIIGELDIDSSERAAFSDDDKKLLEDIVVLIEKRLSGKQGIEN